MTSIATPTTPSSRSRSPSPGPAFRSSSSTFPHNHSSHSSVSLSETLLDEDVKIAVMALGDMRNQGMAGNSITTNAGGTGSGAAPGFVERVTASPLVNSALRVYEQGKANSRVVKYGAQMVESSFHTLRPVIGRLPIPGMAPREPAHTPQATLLAQEEDYMIDTKDSIGRWVETTERERRSSTSNTNTKRRKLSSVSPTRSPNRHHKTLSSSSQGSPGRTIPSPRHRSHRSRTSISTTTSTTSTIVDLDDGSPPPVPPIPPSVSVSTLAGPSPVGLAISELTRGALGMGLRRTAQPTNTNLPPATSSTALQPVPAPSRVEGVVNSALTDDGMRRLKYCLNWLVYATEHIDKQILVLKDFTEKAQRSIDGHTNPHSPPESNSVSVSSQPHTSLANVGAIDSPTTPTPMNSSYSRSTAIPEPTSPTPKETVSSPSTTSPAAPTDPATLHHIRSDLIQTIRQVVGVVSTYGGGKSLDGQAQEKVKGFMLALPARWKDAMRVNPAASTPAVVGPNSPTTPTAATSGAASVQEATITAATKGKKRKTPSSPPRSPVAASPSRSSAATVHTLHAAQKILTLAVESLDMMRGVTGVMKDSLDKADEWVKGVENRRERRKSAMEVETENPSETRTAAPTEDSSVNTSASSTRKTKRLSAMDVDADVSTSAGPISPVDAPSPTGAAGAALGRMSLGDSAEAMK